MQGQKVLINLPPKQEKFCRLYVANGYVGEKAAIEAGYSKRTAYSIASELLKKPELIERIKQIEKPVLDKLKVDEEWVITKLKNFAETNITDFFEINEDGKLQLKDLKKLPKEKVAAIEEIAQLKDRVRIKLVDKRACVVDLGKHIGMFKEQMEGNINHNHTHKVYVVPAFNDAVDTEYHITE